MKSDTSFESRKKDHIKLALDHRTQMIQNNQFDQIGLIHNCLPEMNFSDVNLSTSLFSHCFSSPLFISSMTAGHQQGVKINHLLAELAQNKNILFCLGSQKKQLFSNSADVEFKKIKQKFKKLNVVSNIGLEEVILHKPEKIIRLIDQTEPLALIVHLNSLQEVFQKNEDVIFKNGLKSIAHLVKSVGVPVIIKEVGFGISAQTSKKLFEAGVNVVDVSGSGGTHWGMIEALRSEHGCKKEAITAFADWGSSTIQCLQDHKSLVKSKNIWASGGIRSGVDAAKCLALGAKAVGLAQPILKLVMNKKMKLQPIEKIISGFDQIEFELKVAHFCTGMKTPSDFYQKKVWYERI